MVLICLNEGKLIEIQRKIMFAGSFGKAGADLEKRVFQLDDTNENFS